MTLFAVRADQASLAYLVSASAAVQRPTDDLDIYPLQRTRLAMPNFRLRQGIPVALPPIEVRSASQITVGETQTVNTRPSPLQVSPTSVARWIPSAETYNGATWQPVSGSGRVWQTSGQYAPELVSDFSYYVGKEKVTRAALSLATASQSHLWSSFTPATQTEWSLLLVAIPLPPARNDLGLSDYYGVLETGGPTTSPLADNPAAPVGLRQYATALQYYRGEASNTTRLTVGAQAPTIYAISATASTVRFYRRQLATTWRITVPRTDGTGAWPMNFLLGRAAGTLDRCANMLLLEVDFYTSRLTDEDFDLEAATVYAAYGNYAGTQ